MQGKSKIIFFCVALFLLSVKSWSQGCSTLGQTPYSAFPVCGTTDFKQQTVPSCVNGTIHTFCPNDGNVYQDLNPYWYKFTCYKSGTLALLITPNNQADDYDWQLFDITGHDPSAVYTNDSLIVSYNWSGEVGTTGTSSAAQQAFVCGTIPGQPIRPIFSKMPNIVVGHEYLLMISHFTGSNQSGYALSFPVGGTDGGSASIVNPIVPKITSAYGICDGTGIVVKLASKINCKTIATDGTDFAVSGRTVASASGNGCAVGFDTDSIVLKLNSILTPGTYTVTCQTGTDGNTLSDNCQNQLPVGDNASLKFLPAVPTSMDSMRPVVCIKDTLQLYFSRPMQCSSIAADGTDFFVTGPATVKVKSASGICASGLTSYINIVLTAPIRVNGNFVLHLQNGSDGNTLIDECGQITLAGTLPFTTKNITTADFGETVISGCKYDTVYLTHNGYGNPTQWQWSIDSVVTSAVQNPTLISKAYGPHNVQLAVSNGFCSDTARTSFTFTNNTVKASFAAADTLCPTDTLHFEDRSTANTISWKWNFGNGTTSTIQFPPGQNYTINGRRSVYTARLMVQNSYGCADTAYKLVTVLASCYIAVPTAFTPNGDGLNDYLYPLNAFKADNLEFKIFNRYGQVLFETKDWTKKWDGRVNGLPQPSGTYVWMLEYTDHDTKQKIFQKGTAVLIR